MSFDQIERSNYDGIPTILFEFTLGGNVWRYSGGQSAVTFNGVTYPSINVSREGFTLSGNPDDDSMIISISASTPVAQLFNGTPPSDSIGVAIRSLHRGDTEAPVVWSGFVKSAKRVSTVEFQLTCNSLLSTLNRNGLRLSWGRGCPHALYDRGCKVNPAHYATGATVQAMNGNHLISNAFAVLHNWQNGFLSGGFLTFVSANGTTERRAIEEHWQDAIRLLDSTDGINVGNWVVVYPGCNRTTAQCQARFGNLDNYGGFPHMPNKSPFDGDPVF